MQIGELAKLTGMSTRALRHYEDRGLLLPDRTSGGYRDYSEEDVTLVAHIKAMIAAGLGTATIRRYLDCARLGDHGTSLEMCPDLRAELNSIAECLAAKKSELRETERRLNELASTS
ncbi:MerR family transcriptional regulator [Microbacterium sp. LTA6]